MVKGILNVHQSPYFHFQEYKPQLNLAGELMTQLLEAFLIAQQKNKNGKLLYGRQGILHFRNIFGAKKDDLLKIASVLRKFKEILMSRLIDF